MFRAPSVQSTIRGRDLWPSALVAPTAVRIELVAADGLTTAERELAMQNAMTAVNLNKGMIRQQYLSQRQMFDLGNINYLSTKRDMGGGLNCSYSRNGGLEYLTIRAKATAFLPKPVTTGVVGEVYAVIYYQWTEASGRDLDTLTRLTAPLSPYLGWASYLPAQPVSIFTRAPYDSDVLLLGSERVLSWPSRDNTQYGGEAIIFYFTPLIRQGYSEVVFDLTATWYGVRKSGDITVTVELYINNTAPPDFYSPAFEFIAGGSLDQRGLNPGNGVLYATAGFDTNVAVQWGGSAAALQQLVGQLRITAPLGRAPIMTLTPKNEVFTANSA